MNRPENVHALSRRQRVAVVLNANARKVSQRVISKIRRALPEGDLYCSSTLEESRKITRTIMRRGYQRVLAGGGDGTLALLMDQMCREVESSGHRLPLPEIGVLKLGTGNALASLAGSDKPQLDARRCARPGNGERIHHLELLETDERISFFAGTGLDAMIVNDYKTLSKALESSLYRKVAEGLGGYWSSVFLRTIPRIVFQKLTNRFPRVRLVNAGPVAYRLDGRGRQVGPSVARGETLYQGPCMIAAASTLPYYGFGMKMFPFALDRAGFFQLRVSNAGIYEALRNMPSVWSGVYSSDSILDFHCQKVHLYFSEAVPFQVAGDAEGWTSHATFEISRHRMPIVCYDN